MLYDDDDDGKSDGALYCCKTQRQIICWSTFSMDECGYSENIVCFALLANAGAEMSYIIRFLVITTNLLVSKMKNDITFGILYVYLCGWIILYGSIC